MARFDAEYERVYGLLITGVPVEAVTWRLSAIAPPAVVPVTSLPQATGAPQPNRSRPVRFERGSAPVDTPAPETVR